MDFKKCSCSGKSLARLLQPALMSVLAEEALHGYVVAQRLRELRMFRDARPDYAGLYRVLNTMEAQGLITGEWDTGESGPARRRYSLTSSGRACMATWLNTLKEYGQAIDDLTNTLERRLSKRKNPK